MLKAYIPSLHLVSEIDAHKVRIVMRVKAVWKPCTGCNINNIKYFQSTRESDTDYDSYKHHHIM